MTLPGSEAVMSTTPAVWNLAGAYLHQDWAVEYSTWEEAVDAFIHESPDLSPLLPGEISRVLSETRTDDELHAFFRSQGGAYRPRPEDGGYRGLLTAIARRVEAATA